MLFKGKDMPSWSNGAVFVYMQQVCINLLINDFFGGDLCPVSENFFDFTLFYCWSFTAFYFLKQNFNKHV